MKYAKIENGAVKRYNRLPKVYGITRNFRDASIIVINSKGFFKVVEPPVGKHERLEPLEPSDLVGDEFLARVVSKTPEDIAAIELNEDLDNKEEDGLEYFKTIRNLVQKNYNSGNITEAQFKGIRKVLAPALTPLRVGAWDEAKDNVEDIDEPVNPKMLLLYNKVKDDINDYIINNY
jgi:hypothetical protein